MLGIWIGYYQEAGPGFESKSTSVYFTRGTSLHPESWLTRDIPDLIPKWLIQKIWVGSSKLRVDKHRR